MIFNNSYNQQAGQNYGGFGNRYPIRNSYEPNRNTGLARNQHYGNNNFANRNNPNPFGFGINNPTQNLNNQNRQVGFPQANPLQNRFQNNRGQNPQPNFPMGNLQNRFQNNEQFPHQNQGNMENRFQNNIPQNFPNNSQNNHAQQNEPYHDPTVTYEPFDPSMLEQIKKNPKDIKPDIDITHNNEHTPTKETNKNIYYHDQSLSYKERLHDIMQSNINAANFYKYMSKISDGKNKDMFLKMSLENQEQNEECKKIFKTKGGNSFIPDNTPYEYNINFKQGVLASLQEECTFVKNLSDLYGETNSYEQAKYMNKILFKKICDIACLNLLAFNIS